MGAPRLPSASRSVAVTVSVKSVSVIGVIIIFANDQPRTSMAVCPALAVKLWPLPSLRVAPTGMALTTSDASELLSPASPPTVALIVPNLIDEPSTPISAEGDQLTAGASGLTVTASVVLTGAPRLPSASCSVAVTVSVKLVSVVGVIIKFARDQPRTSMAVCPALAVKLWPLPSLRVAPTGMALTTSDARELLSPVIPPTVALIVPNLIDEPSTPISAEGDQLTVAASGLTVTAAVACVVVLVFPSESAAVAAIPSVKFVSLGAVIVSVV